MERCSQAHNKNELITKFTILAYKMVQQTMHN